MTVRENELLARHTTFTTGGPARYFIEATSVAEVQQAMHFAEEKTLPLLVLGGGSNLLIADAGFPGVVVAPRLQELEVETESESAITLRVGAGVLLDELVVYTVARGWWGLENLSSIPGTVGAAPVQNVGAYGVEMSDVVASVTVLNRQSGEVETLSSSDCQFSYRHSLFKAERGRYIITSVSLTLSKVPRPQLTYGDLQTIASDETLPSQSAIRKHVQAVRANKFPDWTKEGTAGSFFMNPVVPADVALQLQERYPAVPTFPQPDGMVKVPLGWVLDKVLGYKGHRVGKVRCYEGQALVVVADHGATTDEVRAFTQQVAQAVYDATGIAITPEVTCVE